MVVGIAFTGTTPSKMLFSAAQSIAIAHKIRSISLDFSLSIQIKLTFKGVIHAIPDHALLKYRSLFVSMMSSSSLVGHDH